MKTTRSQILFTIVAAVLLAGRGFAQCPDSITGMSPAGGATNVPSVGTLTWSIANGASADYFRVFFGPAGQGCSLTTPTLVTSYGGPNFTINYQDLAPNTAYEWKVEAVRNGCSTIASSCATFTSSPCSSQKANLIYPVDGATADHLTVKFSWDPVFGATGYNVVVDGTQVGSTTTATDLIAVIQPGNHQWYVETLFGPTCTPSRSSIGTFSTACPTDTPSLVSPAAGQSLNSPQNITFSWTAVSGADGYDVFVQQAGGTPQLIGSPREGVNLAATTVTTSLAGPGNYSWYVNALSSGCPSMRSASSNFTVVDICPKTPPTLIAPAGGTTVSANVTFSWSAVPNATGLSGYKVLVSINGAAPAVVATTTDTTATASLPAGSHSWFVEADFAQCPPLLSLQANFIIAAPPVCPSAGPALVSPQDGATNVASPVTFVWSPLANASAYLLFVGSSGAPPVQVQSTESTSASAFVAPGPVEWYVQAVVEGCAPASSAHAKFTAAPSASCPTAAPTLIGPVEGTTITRAAGDPPISFVWSAIPTVKNYVLTVINNGQTIAITTDRTIVQSGSNLSLAAGSVEWYVIANYDGCPATASSHAHFTLVDAPPCVLSAPTPLSPANGSISTDTVVLFRWSSIDRATEYRVYAKTNPNSADLALIGRTSGDTTLQATLPFGANQWAVEAAGGSKCTPARSAAVSFTINRAPVCNTTAPPLVSPNAGQTVTNPVQFIWNAVNGATGYRLWIVPAGGTPTPMGPVTDPSVLTATANAPEGDNEWFVEATFPGCDSAISEHRRFTVTPCSARPATLTLPFESANNLTSPVTLAWTAVTGATSYDIYVGQNGQTPAPIASVVSTGASSQTTSIDIALDSGPTTWYVRAFVPNCTPRDSAQGHFFVVPAQPCGTLDTPALAAQGEVTANQPYPVVWDAVGNARSYELQESKTPDFANPTTVTVNVPQNIFSHDTPVPTFYYYRVRAKSSCSEAVGAWSAIAIVHIIPSTSTEDDTRSTTSIGSQQVILQQVFIPGTPNVTRRFTARTDKSWITVTPSSGDLPPAGITLTLTADPRDLSPGTNSATIIIEYPSAAGTIRTEDTTPSTTVPVSVNLVAPVLGTGKEAPAADALIIPAVASANGANGSRFTSDVRLTNTSAQSTRYNVLFTPSNSDGTRNSRQASVDVAAGQTIALNDVLKSWYGAGAAALTGVLDIRPLNTGSTNTLTKGRTSLGSSRTYNTTPDGTYGQFIPAIPYAQFASKGQTLTMNELAESPQYRTNLGLVEASGQPATVHVTAFGSSGNVLGGFDVFLQPGEQKQINSVLRANNITSTNARLDVQVTSASGKVMAYASVLDNRTNDPMLVSPKQLGTIQATNTVVPGIADISNGATHWKSDVVITNGGTAAAQATVTFYPTGDPKSAKSITTTIAPNESKQMADILNQSFGITNNGGALHVTTGSPSSLMVSARTYNDLGNGTYGQFIPGITDKEGIGVNDGAFQVQQIEESAAFRSNVGIAEMTGNAVQVEVTAVQPDSKIAPRAVIPLQANEFVQLDSVSKQLGVSTLYDGRVSIRVISGNGRVAVYGSVVDNKTQDPTYIPGEQ